MRALFTSLAFYLLFLSLLNTLRFLTSLHFISHRFYFPSFSRMPINRDPTTPPPMIGKIGPYTVFVTPPSTPKPVEQPVFESPRKVVAPPVQPPPQQFVKPGEDASALGFFKNAVAKVQNAHSSLDDHLARWFGLNQSKYQWALDDYYENKGLEKEVGKAKEISSKVQSV